MNIKKERVWDNIPGYLDCRFQPMMYPYNTPRRVCHKGLVCFNLKISSA